MGLNAEFVGQWAVWWAVGTFSLSSPVGSCPPGFHWAVSVLSLQ